MNNLCPTTKINFTKMVNNSFTVNLKMNDKVSKALARPDLLPFVRAHLEKTFLQGPQLLTGKEALYASLGQFDAIPLIDMDKEICPVNVKYTFDFDEPKFLIRFNKLNTYEANFLLAYILWRTGETILDSDCEWLACKVQNAIVALDFIKFDTIVLTDSDNS